MVSHVTQLYDRQKTVLDLSPRAPDPAKYIVTPHYSPPIGRGNSEGDFTNGNEINADVLQYDSYEFRNILVGNSGWDEYY